MSLYEDLEVPPSASPEEVKRAFKKKAGKAHPDREGGSTEAFQVVQHAYSILGDPVKRARYDQTGADDTVPDLRAAAIQQLSAMVLQAIEGCRDPATFNLMQHLSQAIAQGIQNAQQQIKAQEAKIEKFVVAGKRLARKKKKTGHDFLLAVLEATLRQHRAALEGMKNGVLLGEEMKVLLKDYDYKADEPTPTQGGSYGSLADIAAFMHSQGYK